MREKDNQEGEHNAPRNRAVIPKRRVVISSLIEFIIPNEILLMILGFVREDRIFRLGGPDAFPLVCKRWFRVSLILRLDRSSAVARILATEEALAHEAHVLFMRGQEEREKAVRSQIDRISEGKTKILLAMIVRWLEQRKITRACLMLTLLEDDEYPDERIQQLYPEDTSETGFPDEWNLVYLSLVGGNIIMHLTPSAVYKPFCTTLFDDIEKVRNRPGWHSLGFATPNDDAFDQFKQEGGDLTLTIEQFFRLVIHAGANVWDIEEARVFLGPADVQSDELDALSFLAKAEGQELDECLSTEQMVSHLESVGRGWIRVECGELKAGLVLKLVNELKGDMVRFDYNVFGRWALE